MRDLCGPEGGVEGRGHEAEAGFSLSGLLRGALLTSHPLEVVAREASPAEKSISRPKRWGRRWGRH